MQHKVVAPVGTSAPVGWPPDGVHEPPVTVAAAIRVTLPGLGRLAHAVGSGIAGPV